MIDGEQVFKRPHLNVGDSSVENIRTQVTQGFVN